MNDATIAPATTGTGMLIRAFAFAAEKHRHQRRKDAESSPYINHPIALADVLANEGGIDDPVTLCAAILHDTIEDTQTTQAELAMHFGAEVAAIVAEVTDDKALPKPERKRLQVVRAANASAHAKLVKLADKICNLRDLLASPPVHWPLQRQQAYFDWSAQVIAGLRGVHAPLEALFDAVYARRRDLR